MEGGGEGGREGGREKGCKDGKKGGSRNEEKREGGLKERKKEKDAVKKNQFHKSNSPNIFTLQSHFARTTRWFDFAAHINLTK